MMKVQQNKFWAILLSVVVILLSSIMATAALSGSSTNNPWESSLRLPKTVYPLSYDLYLFPDLSVSDNQTFNGSVTIRVNSSEPRNYFQIHEKDLKISNTVVKKVMSDGSKKEVLVTDAFKFDPDSAQFWIIKTEDVSEGVYDISMSFTGKLTGKIVGFYHSQYTDKDNKSISLATSKFQPTYARQAFPCFDEPSFRSHFTISIVRPSVDYVSVSNMPIEKEIADSPSTGLTTTTFKSSVSMVTYLACFIVSDFKRILTTFARPNGDIFEFSVYAPREKLYGMSYSMRIGIDSLHYFEDLFKIDFPLPKCDMAAIPDYVSGATEHWGIITYRETNLFYHKSVSSRVNKQRVASVVAHEMAHQWFGNLVTLEWWDDIWLNEAFATFMSYKALQQLEPLWDPYTQFVVDELQHVFNIDSLLSSHPITPKANAIQTRENITALFDVISYNKGASVLRMLESFMGPEVFRAGVNSFLVTYKYGNAVTKDLYDQLTLAWKDYVPEGEESDINAIMNTWTMQMGYPVVTVTRNGGNLMFTQKRFLQNPKSVSNSTESPFQYKWSIPITVITDRDGSPKQHWFYHNKSSPTIPINATAKWFKVNFNQVGYYRVNYDADMWKTLGSLCREKVLSAADRSSLYDDVLSLADAHLLNYSVALDFTQALETETEYAPWYSAIGKLIVMDHLMLSTNMSAEFRDYVQQLIGPTYMRLGWASKDTDSHLDSLLRYRVVHLTCMSGHDHCLNEAGSLLGQWIENASFPLSLSTKNRIYRWGLIRRNDAETWNTMWARCMAETLASERANLYYGLANSQNETILLNYITMAQDEDNVRSQDFLRVLTYISTNPVGTGVVWQWVRNNWNWLVDRYTLEDRYLGKFIPAITKYFATQERLDEMNAFFKKYPKAGAGERARKQAIEKVEYNKFWVKTYGPIIETWLAGRKTE